jgi:hypothetical protein
MKDQSSMNMIEFYQYQPKRSAFRYKSLSRYSILAASIAITFAPTVQAADYIWTSGYYSATGLPLTIPAADRLISQTTDGKAFDGSAFVNNGSLSQADAYLYLGSGNSAATVTNAGTWDFKGDVGLAPNPGSVGGTFTNTGTLVKSTGSGSSVIYGGVNLTNSGTLDAQTGTLDYQVTNPIFNKGTVFAGSGRHVLSNGGVFNSDFTFKNNLQFAAGSFDAAAPDGVTLTSNLLWSTGGLYGNWVNGVGQTLTTNTAGVNKGFGGTFTNNGTVAETEAYLYLGSGNNVVTVTNAGTWDFKGDVGLSYGPGSIGGNFINTGTLVKSAGIGSSVIIPGQAFTNSGTLDAQTGTLDYQVTNPIFNKGTVFAGSGRHVLSNGGVFNSDFTFKNNLQFAAGSFDAAAPDGVTLTSNLLWSTGGLYGNWVNGVGQTLTTNTAGVNKGFGGTFTNNGTVAETEAYLYLGSGNNVVTVTNAGTWDFKGDVGLSYGPGSIGGNFINTGTLVKSAGIGSSVIIPGQAFTNSGKIDVQTGTVQVAQDFNNQGNIHVTDGAAFGVSGANFSNDTSGFISGQGTIDPAITLTNSGVIQPGDNGLGILHLDGDYLQTSAGILDIGIGGSDSFSVLDIKGNATWGGTLKVSFLDGFIPTLDELFRVALFSGTFNGQFVSLDTSAFTGVTFSTIYDSHNLSLKVIAVNSVPLPPALCLFGSTLIGMTWIGLRKRT